MTIEELQGITKTLVGVTEDIKWEHHLCFNVGDKMFLVTAPDDVPVSASFKVSDESFEEGSCKEGFMPAPYMARNKGVRLDDISRLSQKEWTFFIKQSSQLVASKLPVKSQKALGLK